MNDQFLLPTSSAPKRRCGCLANWKPLQGWSLGMVYTWFMLILCFFIFLSGFWHCRAYRKYTTVECNMDISGCNVQMQYGSTLSMDRNITRTSLMACEAVRMTDGVVKDTKGMKKREIQRLDYGALLKYKEEVGARKYPARGCISWRQTGACDPNNGVREAEYDRPCNELIANGHSGYCECDGGDAHDSVTSPLRAEGSSVSCEHAAFTCEDMCTGAVYEEQSLVLTEYDMGRRESKRSVDKVQKYINNRGVNTAKLEAGFGWTWTGVLIFCCAITAAVITCCVGELENERKDHRY